MEERLERGERDRCRDLEGGLPGGDGRLTWSRACAEGTERRDRRARAGWTVRMDARVRDRRGP